MSYNTPVSLTAGVSGVLPSANGGVGSAGLSPAAGGPVASILNANMTLTTDQVFTFLLTPGSWVIRRIIAKCVSGAFGVACLGGIYSGAGKSGSIVVAATQSFVLLTASPKYVDLTLGTLVTTDVLTATTLFLSLSTGNTGALVANIYVFGDVLS